MASAAAQAFFDKQSPKDRMAIIDSWGGADLTDEWFKNAQAAGSAPAAGAAAPAAGAAPAPGSAAALRAEYGVGSADELRTNWRNYDSSKDVFHQDDADIDADAQYYDEAASRAAGRPQYRSRRAGVQGMVDKAGDCPEGATLHGSRCISNEQANEIFGGGYGGVPEGAYAGSAGAGGGGGRAAANGAAAPGYFGQDDPLQRMLTNQMATGAGTFGGTQTGGQFAGGGVFSQGSGQRGAPLTGAAVAAPVPAAPAVNPAASALTAFSGGGGSALAPKQENAVVGAGGIAPLGTSGFENAVSGAGSIAPLGMPNANAVVGAGSIAPLGKQPDAFGVAPGSGSFEDLIDPRRKKQDARLGGSWF